MSGGGKSVCKGRMGASIATAVDTKDFANNETKLQKVCVKMWLFLCCVVLFLTAWNLPFIISSFFFSMSN